jgi:hypothetical protein
MISWLIPGTCLAKFVARRYGTFCTLNTLLQQLCHLPGRRMRAGMRDRPGFRDTGPRTLRTRP